MTYIVVLGRTGALVDDFGEIIDSAMPPRGAWQHGALFTSLYWAALERS